MTRCWCLAWIFVCGFAMPLRAAPHEARLALHGGRIRVAELTALFGEALHVPGAAMARSVSAGEIDLNGMNGSVFVRALNASLKDGCRVSVCDDALIVQFDPEKFPHEIDAAKRTIRDFTAEAAPQATADQGRLYGLLLPTRVDETKPLVVLVHGLDCDKENWRPMAELLIGQGYQVGYFTYPSDGPLQDSASWFAGNMVALRETFPTTRVDVIAHSMGGVVARAYVEGEDYAGGIDHLILIAPPNCGSNWSRYRMILEIEEHYHLWQHEPTWSPTWAITDGLGEAGRDLKPNSKFLTDLNARPRRAGVKYTIIAGSQHPAMRMMGELVEAGANVIPDRCARWWAVGSAKLGMEAFAKRIESQGCASDGPVRVESTKLEGVSDWVLLPADHVALYYPCDGRPPAAWETVQDRLHK